MRMIATLALAGCLGLAGCEGEWDDRQAAIYFCLSAGLESMGEPEVPPDMSQQEAEEVANQFGNAMQARFVEPSTFKLEPDGRFKVDWGDLPWVSPGETLAITCTGDFNRHMIETVVVNGTPLVPEDGEGWSFQGPSPDPMREAENAMGLVKD